MSVSHNTRKLQGLATELQDADLDGKVTEKVRALEIPVISWPLMAVFGAASTYGRLRQASEDASSGLDTAVTALGSAVKSIADYYKRMEEEQGADFDTVDLESC